MKNLYCAYCNGEYWIVADNMIQAIAMFKENDNHEIRLEEPDEIKCVSKELLIDKNWCAMCGTFGDHSSGQCKKTLTNRHL